MGDFSEKTKLTERTVAAARPASVKSKSGHPCAKFYLDTELRGFGLAVSAPSAKSPGGTKSYFVMRRVQDRQERHVFGRAKELTVAEARARAVKLLLQMTDGMSLNTQRRQGRAEAKRGKERGVTLGQALVLYEGTLNAKDRSPRTIKGYRYFAEKYLAGWLDRPLAEITRAEVRKRHADIPVEIARGEHLYKKPAADTQPGKKVRKNRPAAQRLRGADAGKLTANHAMRAFRAIYNRAMREHPELPVNPIINVDWNKEQRRTGRIPAEGLAKWHEGVNAITNPVRRDYLLFALFTGLRRTNAAEVKWEDVDFARRALHVPKPKSQRPFDLPLSDFLLELLERRREENNVLAPDSPWVFPAARGEGHLVEVRKDGGDARTKQEKKAAIATDGPRYTPHDLRRTFISVAESLGISREARQLLVNHATPKSDVHGGYVIPELDELRAHMQQISARLQALCQPKPPDTTVVPMRKKAAKVA
jgi:integrase